MSWQLFIQLLILLIVGGVIVGAILSEFAPKNRKQDEDD